MMFLAIIFSLFLGGCAGSQGFDRDAMLATLRHDRGTNAAATATGTWTTAGPPLRLALYFVDQDFPAYHAIRKAEWTDVDKEMLRNQLVLLREDQQLSDPFILEDVTIRGHDPGKIRQAAARHGADAVLIIEGVGAVDRYTNRWAWLYPTLIGAYLAPGTESDALFIIDGSLWDVRADRPAARQRVEGTSKLIGPVTSVEDDEALQQAKHDALDTFGKRMIPELPRVAGSSSGTQESSW
jgi:rhombotail lipoprotein